MARPAGDAILPHSAAPKHQLTKQSRPRRLQRIPDILQGLTARVRPWRPALFRDRSLIPAPCQTLHRRMSALTLIPWPRPTQSPGRNHSPLSPAPAFQLRRRPHCLKLCKHKFRSPIRRLRPHRLKPSTAAPRPPHRQAHQKSQFALQPLSNPQHRNFSSTSLQVSMHLSPLPWTQSFQYCLNKEKPFKSNRPCLIKR